MNSNIYKLYNIAQKKSRLILGLMSGTSLDGLDLVLCKITGNGAQTELQILEFETVNYSFSFRNEIKAVFSKVDVNTKMLCAMNAKIGIAHAHLVNKALNKWNITSDQVDIIASHGQTIYHAPRSLNQAFADNKQEDDVDSLMISKEASHSNEDYEYPNSTLQIGDGDHIAVNTGIITISDFRQKHVAAGGEGAPLVIYGDYLLFGHSTENRIMLNIGGISNFTFLPSDHQVEGLFATDLGPGNTLMNQYMQFYYSKEYDENGEIASSGKVNRALLKSLLEHPFFLQEFPKTTGPELFNLPFLLEAQKKSNTEMIDHADVMATLCLFTAKCIGNGVWSLKQKYPDLWIYVSGGGYKNSTLMKNISKELEDMPIENTSVLGMNPDAKEAVLFALLANETIAGAPLSFTEVSGAPAVCFGKISFPN